MKNTKIFLVLICFLLPPFIVDAQETVLEFPMKSAPEDEYHGRHGSLSSGSRPLDPYIHSTYKTGSCGYVTFAPQLAYFVGRNAQAGFSMTGSYLPHKGYGGYVACGDAYTASFAWKNKWAVHVYDAKGALLNTFPEPDYQKIVSKGEFEIEGKKFKGEWRYFEKAFFAGKDLMVQGSESVNFTLKSDNYRTTRPFLVKVPDVEDPKANLTASEIELRFPENDIWGWKFAGYTNGRYYFYRSSYGDSKLKNKYEIDRSGVHQYEFQTFAQDGKALSSWLTEFKDDGKDDVKHDVRCEIPSFDPQHIYIVRVHLGAEGKQVSVKKGFEVAKLDLDGKLTWNKFIPFPENEKYGFANTHGPTYTFVRFEYGKIIMEKVKPNDWGGENPTRHLVVLDTDGSITENRILPGGRFADKVPGSFTYAQDFDIKHLKSYDTVRKLTQDKNNKVLQVLWFDDANQFVWVYDRKRKMGVIYKPL